MKIGQMASYLDDGMPEPMRDALATLQQDAPPMAPELCASVVRAELGARPDRVFATWDPIPIAAASIGQVHRARRTTGATVAVKVQYPGVDDAIRADLTTSDLLFRAMSLMFPGLDPGPLVEELRARLVEELDYDARSREPAPVRRLLRGPSVHPHPARRRRALDRARADDRVLATARASPRSNSGRRRSATSPAEAIFRFVFRSLYRLHAFNGDPHPGNYLFHGNGVVTFLDFGLVKRYEPDEVALFEELIRTMVLEHDIARVPRRCSKTHGILRPDAPFGDDDVLEYFGHFYEFVMEDEVVTLSPEYSSETRAALLRPRRVRTRTSPRPRTCRRRS